MLFVRQRSSAQIEECITLEGVCISTLRVRGGHLYLDFKRSWFQVEEKAVGSPTVN